MTLRVALLTIGDGRDHLLAPTTASLYEMIGSGFVHHVHVDDRAHRLGFAGAIQDGWNRLRDLHGFDYVWHLEEDFVTLRPVPIGALALLLELQPHLAQVALRRQAVAPAEVAAGGVVDLWPAEYADRFLTYAGAGEMIDLAWLEHRLYFTTNPSLYRRELIDSHRWPDAPASEAAFTDTLRDAGYRFALWGRREDEPLVQHTGTIRHGRGY